MASLHGLLNGWLQDPVHQQIAAVVENIVVPGILLALGYFYRKALLRFFERALKFIKWFARVSFELVCLGCMPRQLKAWSLGVLKIVGIRAHSKSLNSKLLRKTLLTYSDEERRHVTGETSPSERPQNRIFTSFVSYGAIVKSAVEEAQRCSRENPTGDLVCFTTLKMPPPQWFNNKLRYDRDDKFPYLEVDKNWSNYLEYIYSVPNGFGGKARTVVHRYIQTADDGMPKGLPLHDYAMMRNLGRAKILLPQDVWQHPETYNFQPFEKEQIKELIPHVGPKEVQDFIVDRYSNSELAYIMIPEQPDLVPLPIDFGGHTYEWLTVAEALSMFCRGDPDNCMVLKSDRSDWGAWYSDPDAAPNDIFLIGSQPAPAGRIDWHLALAGTPDSDCKMVRLEFGSRDMQLERVQKAFDFADKMLQRAKDPQFRDKVHALSEWK